MDVYVDVLDEQDECEAVDEGTGGENTDYGTDSSEDDISISSSNQQKLPNNTLRIRFRKNNLRLTPYLRNAFKKNMILCDKLWTNTCYGRQDDDHSHSNQYKLPKKHARYTVKKQ